MAMVVMGGMCVQSITAIHTTIINLCWKRCFIAMAMVLVGHICTQNKWSYTTLSTSYRLPEAIAMATCNFVGKMLLTTNEKGDGVKREEGWDWKHTS